MMNEVNEVFKLANEGRLPDAITLIKSLVDKGADIRGVNVGFAHILFLGADWAYINKLLPKQTNTFSDSGFLKSIGQGRPLNASDHAIPWFTYPAIDFLNRIIKPTWKVFEFGSGNSTLWWSSKTAEVTSVEDNAEWVSEISGQMPQNVNLIHRQNEEYWNAIESFQKESFDVITIDGSYRNDCLKQSLPYLKNDGVFVFDNSDRKEYDESSELLKKHNYYRIDFFGTIPSYLYKNCTSIYFKNPEFLLEYEPPSMHQSDVGLTCYQAMNQSS